MEEISEVWCSLGSNLGNRHNFLASAVSAIKAQIGDVVKVSKIYETPPLGFESDSAFLNMCIQVNTKLRPIEFLKKSQEIEQKLGRTGKTAGEYASRVIDIDIIFYGRLISNSVQLHLPHKHFRNRLFVLKPLSDIGLDVVDPVTNLAVSQLLLNCIDKSAITLYENQIFTYH